jgi:hypothetical protein
VLSENEYEIRIWGPDDPLNTHPILGQYYQGEPTKANIQNDCFVWLKGDSNSVFVMIDDHSAWIKVDQDSKFQFKRNDPLFTIPCSEMRDWMMDDINSFSRGMVVRGMKSGIAFGEYPEGVPEWDLINSMEKDETSDPDMFDISQELAQGMTFREAFEREKELLDGYQNPRIRP